MSAAPNTSRIAHEHVDLIRGWTEYHRLLIRLAYLDEDEVQFPPHTGFGKHPLATTQRLAAGFHEDLVAIVGLLPFVTPSRKGFTAISPGSNALTYYEADSEQKLTPELRMWGYNDEGEVDLPDWAIRITAASNRNDSQLIYDMRNKTLSEISLYETTVEELEQAAKPAAGPLSQWCQNLWSLEWITWRPSDGYSHFYVRTRDYENELRLVRAGLAVDPPTIPRTPEQAARLSQAANMSTEINKAQYNEYWSRRLVFESAGWPEAFDRQECRDSIDEWEWESTAIHNEAMRTHRPLMIGDAESGKVMREYYRRAAGHYAV